MVKVRARDVKLKVGTDFAKKKVKVGRKVMRANVTEIRVKSKRINMPLQDQGIPEGSDGSHAAIALALKQLHHHSEATRQTALHKLKDMMSLSRNESSSFVTLVLPETVELLFDEEKDVRVAVNEVLSAMLAKYASEDFSSVISIVVTYICSGLTNLHKVGLLTRHQVRSVVTCAHPILSLLTRPLGGPQGFTGPATSHQREASDTAGTLSR